MKTLSSAELQEAIRYSTECVKNGLSKSNDYQLHLEHLVALLDEQRRRASERVELTLEPMTTTLERVEFDARVAAQDGPEWVEWHGGECPVEPGEDTEVEFRDGQTRRDEYPEGWRWHHKNSSLDIMRYRTWEQSK